MNIERDLQLIVAFEAFLVLCLLFLNAFFLSRKPILKRLKEIYFVNGHEFRSAWYVVLTASLLLVVSQTFSLLEFLGLQTRERVVLVSLVLQFFFATLLILAFFQVFRIFAKYIQRLPPNDREIDQLIHQDLRRAILLEDYDSNANLDLSRVGDVYTGRKRLGPYLSLTHYRGMMSGFTEYTDQKLGQVADALLYSVGRLTARNAMLDILKEIPDKDRALHRIFDEIRANGIAIPEVLDRTPERIDVRLYENATSAGVEPHGYPICHYQSGMLSGIFEVLTGRRVFGHEVKCWGLGDKFCDFQLELEPVDVHLAATSS